MGTVIEFFAACRRYGALTRVHGGGVTKKSQNIKQTVLFSFCFPAFRGKSQVKVMLGL